MYYYSKQLGRTSREFDWQFLNISSNRYLLKAMQQMDENSEIDAASSIAYLYATRTAPSTIVNLDDYCRLFECRSQM